MKREGTSNSMPPIVGLNCKAHTNLGHSSLPSGLQSYCQNNSRFSVSSETDAAVFETDSTAISERMPEVFQSGEIGHWRHFATVWTAFLSAWGTESWRLT